MKNKDQSIPEIIEELIKSSNGEETIRKYTKGEFLGKGGFAKCYIVIESGTNKVWACKAIAKSSLLKPKHHLKLRSEIKIHCEMQHENVVKFERNFEDNEFHYILMELCSNQSLKELLKRRKRLTEIECQYYIFQIVTGLKYIHSHLVIHRDIKLGNLYLTSSMLLKIGDFGLAAKLETAFHRRKTICGTPNYIAPEVLEQKDGHSFESDIWSVGVILYALLIGKPPFESQNVKHTYKKIRMNSYTFPETPAISKNAENLIRKLLTSNPSKRITLDEIYQHEFMTCRTIPKRLPPITMTNDPPEAFLQKYLVSGKNVIQPVKKMEMTYQFLTSQKGKESGLTSTIVKLKLNSVPSTILKTNNLVQTMRPFTTSKNINIIQNRNNSKIQSSIHSIKPQTPAFPSTISSTINGTSRQGNQLSYLDKWKDLTEKYGILYILSNGLYGMFYNDLSNVIVNPITMKATYSDLKKKNGLTADRIISNLNLFPENLNKKVKIFKLFMKTISPIDKSEKDSITESDEYLKSFAKTKHGFLFRISNGITQMGFVDNSSIVINYKQNIFIYITKQGEVNTCSLQTNLLSITDPHALKRLKYTLNLINSLKGSTNYE